MVPPLAVALVVERRELGMQAHCYYLLYSPSLARQEVRFVNHPPHVPSHDQFCDSLRLMCEQYPGVGLSVLSSRTQNSVRRGLTSCILIRDHHHSLLEVEWSTPPRDRVPEI